MYKCPNCGSNNVKIVRVVTFVEYWNGDFVDREEAVDERAPENATIECMDCGEEDPSIGCLDDWQVY